MPYDNKLLGEKYQGTVTQGSVTRSTMAWTLPQDASKRGRFMLFAVTHPWASFAGFISEMEQAEYAFVAGALLVEARGEVFAH